MPDTTISLEFLGEQVARLIEENRETRGALASILRTLDHLAASIEALRGEIAAVRNDMLAVKVEVRALADRLDRMASAP